MRSMFAVVGLALVCSGCAFPAPPVDAAAYPTPDHAANSEAAQDWWKPFDPDAGFVAVSGLDDRGRQGRLSVRRPLPPD
jgi:hypothetical protein